MTIKRGMRCRNSRTLEIDEVVLDDNQFIPSNEIEDGELDLLNDLDMYGLDLLEKDLGEDEDLELPDEDLGEDEDLELPDEDLDEDEDLELSNEEDIISQFKPCNVSNKTRKITATGSGVTIVKANTGNRIVLNHSIVSALGISTDIQFGYSESSSQLMIGKDLPNDFAKYNVKIQKNQSAIVYNKNLVTAIVSNFGLDFTSCTSQTFSSWTVVTQNNIDIVLVDIC